jgi:hypothetical protein
MKNSRAIDFYYQFQGLIEIAAERGAGVTFWREADKIKSSLDIGPQEIQLLKDLMLQHGLWF